MAVRNNVYAGERATLFFHVEYIQICSFILLRVVKSLGLLARKQSKADVKVSQQLRILIS